jgi:hypothetical protein
MTDRTTTSGRAIAGAKSSARGGPSGREAVGHYVGQPAGDAAQAVRRAGLRPGLDRLFGCAVELIGLVVAQDPTAGSSLARNGMVTLYVAAPGTEPTDDESDAARGGNDGPEPALAQTEADLAEAASTPVRLLRRKPGRAGRAAQAFEAPSVGADSCNSDPLRVRLPRWISTRRTAGVDDGMMVVVRAPRRIFRPLGRSCRVPRDREHDSNSRRGRDRLFVSPYHLFPAGASGSAHCRAAPFRARGASPLGRRPGNHAHGRLRPSRRDPGRTRLACCTSNQACLSSRAIRAPACNSCDLYRDAVAARHCCRPAVRGARRDDARPRDACRAYLHLWATRQSRAKGRTAPGRST